MCVNKISLISFYEGKHYFVLLISLELKQKPDEQRSYKNHKLNVLMQEVK